MHTAPHAPQFDVSEPVSTQDEAHSVLPPLQETIAVQVPPWHTEPLAQTTPHPPQWAESELSLTQAPLQFV